MFQWEVVRARLGKRLQIRMGYWVRVAEAREDAAEARSRRTPVALSPSAGLKAVPSEMCNLSISCGYNTHVRSVSECT